MVCVYWLSLWLIRTNDRPGTKKPFIWRRSLLALDCVYLYIVFFDEIWFKKILIILRAFDMPQFFFSESKHMVSMYSGNAYFIVLYRSGTSKLITFLPFMLKKSLTILFVFLFFCASELRNYLETKMRNKMCFLFAVTEICWRKKKLYQEVAMVLVTTVCQAILKTGHFTFVWTFRN